MLCARFRMMTYVKYGFYLQNHTNFVQHNYCGRRKIWHCSCRRCSVYSTHVGSIRWYYLSLYLTSILLTPFKTSQFNVTELSRCGDLDAWFLVQSLPYFTSRISISHTYLISISFVSRQIDEIDLTTQIYSPQNKLFFPVCFVLFWGV